MDRSTKPLLAPIALAAWFCGGLVACGAATHEGTLVPQVSQQATPQEQTVPQSTIRRLEACAREAGGRYAKYSHAVRFEIAVTSRGDVTRVKLRDSTLEDGALESCMMRAIAAMNVPVDVLPLRSNQPFSGGERMKQSGEPLGIAQALGGAVALGPIIIVAAGATIGVYIGAVIVDEVVKRIPRSVDVDCKEVKEDCIAACIRTMPTPDHGFKFWNCVKKCMATSGC